MTEPSRFDPNELRSKLNELEAENHDLHRLVDGLRTALSDLRNSELGRLEDIEASRDQALEMKDEAEAQRDAALREARVASRRLEQVYNSFTWKAGRIVKRMIDPLLAIGRGFRRLPRERPDRDESSHRDKSPSSTYGHSTPTSKRASRSVGSNRKQGSQAASLHVEEDTAMKSAYVAATSKREFTEDNRQRIAMAVSTLDFDQGRGDLYVGVGLGRYLERIGYEVVYLDKSQWYEPPPETSIYVALLSSVDASRIPDDPLKVAWARNETENWATNPSLNLYDMLLASSSRSLERLEEVYAGPTGLLPIGVDLELFRQGDPQGRSAVVSTVNQWGRERDVYAALRSQKITFPLAIFGQTRGLSSYLMPYSHGPVSFFALPKIYRQAAVVLDDLNHTTIEYGNVNSRLFESIASGAVPVANTSLGLDALQLHDVPSYSTPAELHEKVADFWSDPEARARRAAVLTEVVRQNHSFERRAQQFHEVVGEKQRHHRSSRSMLAFAPDYRSTNPYQSMLYGSLGSDFVPVPIQDVLDMRELRMPYVNDSILHIHWTAPVLAPARNSTEALRRLNSFLDELASVKENGARVVWTIHNVMPHESGYPDLERTLRQELAEKADAIHVMCERTIEEIGDEYVVPKKKIRVVRHGSYIGVYPDVIDPDVARERLGYAADDTVILFLGGIRHYKGVDLLLDAFEKAVGREPSLRLLIAGRRGNFPGMAELYRRATSHPLIAANLNEIADVDLQHFFKASDVVALPYRTVLNSGSAQLAFSFARPVIVPRTACLPDVESEGVGVSYRQGDTDELAECLVNATSLKDRQYHRAARRLAGSYTGRDMSADFLSILKELNR